MSSVLGVLLCVLTVSFAQKNLRNNWPSCVAEDARPNNPTPITADVREFVKHPDHVRHRVIDFNSHEDIGLFLRETPHEKGEMIDQVQYSSQAWLAGVRKGWIITAINDKRISPGSTLKELATNISAAKAAGSTVKFKFDVRDAVDCFNANCKESDRFPAEGTRHCAIACSRISQCQWWSWDSEGEYKMCFLHGSASALEDTKGFSAGRQGCAPKPHVIDETDWPECIISDADLRLGTPVYTDVFPFIEHLDEVRHKDLIFTTEEPLGMILREEPHDLGEFIDAVVPNSQADNAGVKSGWIIKEINGKPFKKKESVIDVQADFDRAKTTFSTLTVKFDVRSLLDCSNGFCGNSDRFPAHSYDMCASACSQVEKCAYWSFSIDAEDTMCLLRSDMAGLRSETGSVVGSRDCSPPGWGSLLLVVAGLVLLAFVVVVRPLVKRHMSEPTSRKSFLGQISGQGKKLFD